MQRDQETSQGDLVGTGTSFRGTGKAEEGRRDLGTGTSFRGTWGTWVGTGTALWETWGTLGHPLGGQSLKGDLGGHGALPGLSYP